MALNPGAKIQDSLITRLMILNESSENNIGALLPGTWLIQTTQVN
jgi:hypothetical protein